MIILVYGTDALRAKEHARNLVLKFVEKHDPNSLNVDEIQFFKKDELSIPKMSDALCAAPFLAEKRLVRIDGVFTFVTTKPDAAAWIKALERIPSSTIALFVDTSDEKKIEKTELFKVVSGLEGVYVYRFPALDGSELRSWVQMRAKAHGGLLVPAIADSLIRRAGKDSWRLDSEIRKLVAYADGAPVDEDMLSLLVASEFDENMFGMIDAVSSGNPSFALRKVFEERSAGADEFSLFGLLARQVRLILMVKALLRDNPQAGRQNVASTFGLHPFVAQKIVSAAGRHDFLNIQAQHTLAVRLDQDMKRGLRPSIAVDRLIAAMLDGS